MEEEVVEQVCNPEGAIRLTIYRRQNGLFSYSIDRYFRDIVPEFGHKLEYWAPVLQPGIFADIQTVKADASQLHLWVGEGHALGQPVRHDR